VASYRERIERYLESHPGATIREARGHGTTPERPTAGIGKPEFQEYHERRKELENHVNSLKQEAYGSLPNYNAAGAEAATHSMSIGELAKSEPFDTLDDFIEYYDGEVDDGYGYYH
jgi:hypothetical protein